MIEKAAAWIRVSCLLAGLTACGKRAKKPITGADVPKAGMVESVQPSGNVEIGIKDVQKTNQPAKRSSQIIHRNISTHS